MFEKINNLVLENGIPKYIKRWDPVSKDSTLAEVRRHLQKYHSHSFIYPITTKTTSLSKLMKPRLQKKAGNVGVIKFYSYPYEMKHELKSYVETVEDFLDENDFEKLIIDLRHHEGGWYIPVALCLKRYLDNSSLERRRRQETKAG